MLKIQERIANIFSSKGNNYKIAKNIDVATNEKAFFAAFAADDDSKSDNLMVCRETLPENGLECFDLCIKAEKYLMTDVQRCSTTQVTLMADSKHFSTKDEVVRDRYFSFAKIGKDGKMQDKMDVIYSYSNLTKKNLISLAFNNKRFKAQVLEGADVDLFTDKNIAYLNKLQAEQAITQDDKEIKKVIDKFIANNPKIKNIGKVKSKDLDKRSKPRDMVITEYTTKGVVGRVKVSR